MKKFTIYGSVLLMGLAFSMRATIARALEESLFLWKPKVFQSDSQISSSAVSAMIAERDSVTMAILQDSPGFVQEFATRVPRFLTVALNSVLIPGNGVLLEKMDIESADSHYHQPTFGYMIGKTIKAIRLFVGENTLKGLTNEQAPENFKYKYCEEHPEHTTWPCDFEGNEYENNDFWHTTREYIFLRRFTSRPEFISGACPLATKFATWYLNWGYLPGVDTPAKKMDYYKRAFDQIEKTITDINGDGTWQVRFEEHPDYDEEERPSPLDYNFVKFLQRRYLDGGPEYLAALSECIGGFRSAFVNQSLETSPAAYLEVGRLIEFKDTYTYDGTFLADANLSDLTRYRLARTFDPEMPLPENLFYSASGEPLDPWGSDFEKTDVFYRLNNFDRQYSEYTYGIPSQEVHFLNNVDRENDYRFLTVADYERLKEMNYELFRPSDVFCLVGEYPNTNQHFVHVNGQILPVPPTNESSVCIDKEHRTNRFFILRSEKKRNG